jgi:V/A-type H+/Na+-transporting ATPase subunit E
MGFNQLQKDVLNNAQKEADKIIAKANDEAEKIKLELTKENKKLKNQGDAETKNMVELLQKREIAGAKIETNKKLLLAKKEMIDKVFEEVKTKITKNLSAIERKKIIDGFLTKAKTEIDIGNVYCNEIDSKNVTGAVQKEMLGGIIAESKDKTTLVDYSFETILEELKDKHIANVTNILFK